MNINNGFTNLTSRTIQEMKQVKSTLNANGFHLKFITDVEKQITSHKDVTPLPEDLVKEFFSIWLIHLKRIGQFYLII